MDIQKKREAFESLWIQSNGHFKYFVFSQKHGKYIPTGVRDNLTEQELLFASITLNTAYLFFLGGIKTQAVSDGFVSISKLHSRQVVVALERRVESQLEASGINADPCRLDGEKLIETIIKAAEVK